MSSFWQEVWSLSGTTLKHSSAYHPETDGQTEVTNKGVEQYLRSFCMDNPTQWVRFLPWAEFCYNSATHSGTRMTPFQVVYGRLPPPLIAYEGELTTNAAAHEFLVQREHLLKELKGNLLEAQHRSKQMADRSRRDLEFQPGDMVLVKLHPYRQISVADNTFYKLRRRFYGPFKVVKRVGAVAYKLDLPATARIHNVFHVSKLKLWRQDDALHTYELPGDVVGGRPIVMPLAILRQRRILNRQQEELQVLVEWAGLPIEEASWMELGKFQEAYPSFDLEDKVGLQRGGNDTTRGHFYRRRHKWAAELKAGNRASSGGAGDAGEAAVDQAENVTGSGGAGDAGEAAVDQAENVTSSGGAGDAGRAAVDRAKETTGSNREAEPNAGEDI